MRLLQSRKKRHQCASTVAEGDFQFGELCEKPAVMVDAAASPTSVGNRSPAEEAQARSPCPCPQAEQRERRQPPQFLRLGKEREEMRISDNLAVDIAANLDAAETKFVHCAMKLGNRQIDILERHSGKPNEPPLTFRHKAAITSLT